MTETFEYSESFEDTYSWGLNESLKIGINYKIKGDFLFFKVDTEFSIEGVF